MLFFESPSRPAFCLLFKHHLFRKPAAVFFETCWAVASGRIDRDQSGLSQHAYKDHRLEASPSRAGVFMQEPSNSTMNIDLAPPAIAFVDDDAPAEGSEHHHNGISGTAIAVTAVGLGAAAFEAALLPGVVLGVAAMWLPHDVRQAFAPLAKSAAKSAVRGVYRIGRKSKELVADVHEQIQDIMAEVDAESARA
jgi:hypothetical protein